MSSSVIPAAFSIVFGESLLAIQLPNTTPNRLVMISAVPDPKKTIQGDCDCALINRVDSCVLSPISARKMVTNVVAKMTSGVCCLVGLSQTKGDDTSTNVVAQLQSSSSFCSGWLIVSDVVRFKGLESSFTGCIFLLVKLFSFSYHFLKIFYK